MKYIINQVLRNGRYGISAFGKARQDVNDIFAAWDVKPVNIVCRLYKLPFVANIRVVGAYLWFIARAGRNNELFIQYPVSMRKSFSLVLKLLRLFGNKIYFIVHDINSARFGVEKEREIYFLNQADGLFLHTRAMREWLEAQGVTTKNVLLQVFDYLSSDPYIAQEEVLKHKDNVIFAGNLAKSKFVEKLLKYPFRHIRLTLFGNKGDLNVSEDGKEYKGIFSPDHTASIGGGWGLVWDGESLDTCNGDTGNYLRWNAPHKLSLYLAAGLPVIVWKQSAEATFVTDNHIGIAIESIEELDDRIASVTDKEFAVMVDNARKQGDIIRDGGRLKEAYRQLLSNNQNQTV